MRELPVLQCSLDAEAFAARTEAWRALLSNAAVDGVEPRSMTIVVDRAHAPTVEELIGLEGECCPFLTFRVDEHADGLQVRVQVPPGGEATLERLVGAIR